VQVISHVVRRHAAGKLTALDKQASLVRVESDAGGTFARETRIFKFATSLGPYRVLEDADGFLRQPDRGAVLEKVAQEVVRLSVPAPECKRIDESEPPVGVQQEQDVFNTVKQCDGDRRLMVRHPDSLLGVYERENDSFLV